MPITITVSRARNYIKISINLLDVIINAIMEVQLVIQIIQIMERLTKRECMDCVKIFCMRVCVIIIMRQDIVF